MKKIYKVLAHDRCLPSANILSPTHPYLIHHKEEVWVERHGRRGLQRGSVDPKGMGQERKMIEADGILRQGKRSRNEKQ